MTQAVPDSQQYYVGINGQQTGPFSESEVLQKISGGEITAEALIWFQGLSEWQSIKSIPLFDDGLNAKASGKTSAPPAAAAPVPAPSTSGFKPLSENADAAPAAASASAVAAAPAPTPDAPAAATPAAAAKTETPMVTLPKKKQGPEDLEPVFGADEAVFSSGPSFKKKLILFGSGIALVLLAVAVAVVVFGNASLFEKTDIPELVNKAPELSPREVELRRVLSELMLNPKDSVPALEKLVRENPDDAFGKEALDKVLEYHSLHAPAYAGRLLVSLNRPGPAAQYFLKDPPSYIEAESAYEKAFATEKDKAKQKEYLLAQIGVLFGPLQNEKKGVERVKVFEATFPGEDHPYRYYLKTNEEKMTDLFERLSYGFVQSLLAYIESELSQISLKERPKVEFKKEKDGKYRIVGSYKGEVVLNRDRLTDIYFTFWLSKARWYLVDTNLTSERAKWTKQERERRKNESASPEEMLRQLETQFKTAFPKVGLHEKVVKTKTE